MKNLLEEEVKKVLKNYNLEFRTLKRIEGGRINDTYLVESSDNQKLVVQKALLCSSGKFIDAEARFINLLKENNFPVAPILTTACNKNYSKIGDGFWKVSEHIDHDEEAKKTKERIYELGKILGRLHSFFRDYPEKNRLVTHFNHSETSALFERLEDLLTKNKVGKEAIELANSLKKIAIEYKIPKDEKINILHGDPKFNNFLFRGNKIVGILDLDGVNIESEWFDLGDALRSWCKGENMKFKKNLFDTALEGYSSENNREDILAKAKEAMIAITNRLSIKFLIDAFEQKHFRWDKEKYSSSYEQNLFWSRQYFAYCNSTIKTI